MENRAHALAAGLFVVAITALLIAMTLWLTRDTANMKTYDMVSREAVTGLQVEAPVRFKGVSVGRVTSIGFDPKQRSNVLITVAINDSAPITQSTFATLAFQGVTGLSYVQLDDAGRSTDSSAVEARHTSIGEGRARPAPRPSALCQRLHKRPCLVRAAGGAIGVEAVLAEGRTEGQTGRSVGVGSEAGPAVAHDDRPHLLDDDPGGRGISRGGFQGIFCWLSSLIT